MISVIANDNNYFINIHAEQVIGSLFIENFNEVDNKLLLENRGIYQKTLTQTVAQNIAEYLLILKDSNVYLNFSNIGYVANNTYQILKSAIVNSLDKNVQYCIYNLHLDIFPTIVKIKDGINKYNVMEEYCNNNSYLFIGCTDISDCKKLVSQEDCVFEKKLRESIYKCKESHNGKSFSSRVNLSVYLNVKKMFDDIGLFTYYVYKMGLRLIEHKILSNNYLKNRDVKLFAHTMNGATIASILSQMFQLDMVLMDHIGPTNQLEKGISVEMDKDIKYLVVTDVVCLGTELSNVESIMSYLKLSYIGCATLIKINTIKSDKSDKIYALTHIKGEDNYIQYAIGTDFCTSVNGKEEQEL